MPKKPLGKLSAVRISEISHQKLIEMQTSIYMQTGTKMSLSDITNLIIYRCFNKDITFLLGTNK